MSTSKPQPPDHNDSSTLPQTLHDCQAQLVQQQQEMNGLLYAISHDLRAPLRAISGFSQALREQAAATLDSTGLHYLQRVEDSSRRMALLLDGLLSLSRLSQAEMVCMDIDLSRLSQEAASSVAAQYPQHHPQLIIAPDMHVHADARLLKQALQRLFDNAWKCTAGKTDALIEVGHTEMENQPVYYVRDNGIGFDMSFAGKLFVPFQHLHARSELNGIGLGLASFQRIIARHSGRVWAQAKPDTGAQFFFTLPSLTTSAADPH